MGYVVDLAFMLSMTLQGTDSLLFLNLTWHLLWVQFEGGKKIYEKYLKELRDGEFTPTRSPVSTDPGLYNKLLLTENPEGRLKHLLTVIPSHNRTIAS